MIKNVFFEVMPDIWPMLIIITVIVSSLRLAYIITKHKKFQLHKELIYLIFIICHRGEANKKVNILIRLIILIQKLKKVNIFSKNS